MKFGKGRIISTKKIVLIGVTLLLLFIGYFYFTPSGETDTIQKQYDSLSTQTAKKLFYVQSEELTRPVAQRLIELDEKTIGCFGPDKIMAMPPDENLGGQCCGALRDIDSYNLQLDALAKFIEKHGNLEIIPRDPYDISVKDAQRLIVFDRDLALSAEQQNMYDEAMEMSHHGGPCCCRCWKWYAMSGLGKKLIVDDGWDAKTLAELWDTASSCGHDEDTNLHKHYDHEKEGM